MVKGCSIRSRYKLPVYELEIEVVMDPSEVKEILDIEMLKHYIKVLMFAPSTGKKIVSELGKLAIGLIKSSIERVGKAMRLFLDRSSDVALSRDRSLSGSFRRAS